MTQNLFPATTKFLGLFNGGEKLTTYDAGTLPAGWHQLAVTSSVGQTRFFIDGTLVGQVPDNVILEIQTVGNNLDLNSKNLLYLQFYSHHLVFF